MEIGQCPECSFHVPTTTRTRAHAFVVEGTLNTSQPCVKFAATAAEGNSTTSEETKQKGATQRVLGVLGKCHASLVLFTLFIINSGMTGCFEHPIMEQRKPEPLTSKKEQAGSSSLAQGGLQNLFIWVTLCLERAVCLLLRCQDTHP